MWYGAWHGVRLVTWPLASFRSCPQPRIYTYLRLSANRKWRWKWRRRAQGRQGHTLSSDGSRQRARKQTSLIISSCPLLQVLRRLDINFLIPRGGWCLGKVNRIVFLAWNGKFCYAALFHFICCLTYYSKFFNWNIWYHMCVILLCFICCVMYHSRFFNWNIWYRIVCIAYFPEKHEYRSLLLMESTTYQVQYCIIESLR